MSAERGTVNTVCELVCVCILVCACALHARMCVCVYVCVCVCLLSSRVRQRHAPSELSRWIGGSLMGYDVASSLKMCRVKG